MVIVIHETQILEQWRAKSTNIARKERILSSPTPFIIFSFLNSPKDIYQQCSIELIYNMKSVPAQISAKEN